MIVGGIFWHFVKREFLIGVCSHLLFIYCAHRLVTSALTSVFLLFFGSWRCEFSRSAGTEQGSRLWLALITVSIDLMHFRIIQHTRLTRWAGLLWRTRIHSNKTVFSFTNVLLLQNIDIVLYHIASIQSGNYCTTLCLIIYCSSSCLWWALLEYLSGHGCLAAAAEQKQKRCHATHKPYKHIHLNI